jgi:hypothetical protein
MQTLDIKDLVQHIRELVHDIKCDRFTDAMLVRMINLGLVDVAHNALYFRKTEEVQFGLDGKIELPEDLIRLYYIEYNGNYIEFVTRNELRDRGIFRAENKGTPYVAVIGVNPNKTLEFYPIPTDDIIHDSDRNTVKLHYAYTPKQIQISGGSSCDSNNPLTFTQVDENIAIDLFNVLTYYVLKEIYLADKDTNSINMSNMYSKKYQQEIMTLRRKVQKQHAFLNNSTIRFKLI